LKRNLIVLVVVVAALGAIVWAGITNYQRRKAERAQVLASQPVLVPDESAEGGVRMSSALEGKAAPNFSLVDLAGHKVSLADYKGKAVLVNFWATWCGPCKVEIPWLMEFRNRYRAEGFEVLGISEDDLDKDNSKKLSEEKSEIAKFAAENKMEYPVLPDLNDAAGSFGGVESLPESFYIGRNGVIVASFIGLDQKAAMDAKIQKALGSK
jgi:cytochrome c biogenesis protein CcmG/thiol:disulfide interchange protein DsbE